MRREAVKKSWGRAYGGLTRKKLREVARSVPGFFHGFRCPWLCLALLFAAAAGAQERALLTGRESLQLYQRMVQLMESTSVASPEMARAGAPVVENARGTLAILRSNDSQGGLNYSFLANVKAYLALADAIPKTAPLPEQANRQFAELRESVQRAEVHFRALLDRKEAQIRNPDRDNLKRYAEANARLAPPQADKPRVVFLGDSITDGWRLNEYFPERDFVNRGIGGQITGEMLGRMKADVFDLKPAAMLVLAGTNDIARGVSVETIKNNLTMIADLAESHKIVPLFASVLPVSDYHKERNPQYEMTKRRPPETIRALNVWLAEFCRQRRYPYVDYFTALADSAGMLKADLADDGLHPNSAGYRIMAPIALAAIDKTAAPAQKAKKRRFPF